MSRCTVQRSCLHFESCWVDRALIQIFTHIPHYRQTMRVQQTYTTQKDRQSSKVDIRRATHTPSALGLGTGKSFLSSSLEVSTKILCALRTYLPSCDRSNHILWRTETVKHVTTWHSPASYPFCSLTFTAWHGSQTPKPVFRGTLLVAQLVEALRYKTEGRGFDSRWCHWNFSLT